jgi:hypothetical protein
LESAQQVHLQTRRDKDLYLQETMNWKRRANEYKESWQKDQAHFASQMAQCEQKLQTLEEKSSRVLKENAQLASDLRTVVKLRSELEHLRLKVSDLEAEKAVAQRRAARSEAHRPGAPAAALNELDPEDLYRPIVLPEPRPCLGPATASWGFSQDLLQGVAAQEPAAAARSTTTKALPLTAVQRAARPSGLLGLGTSLPHSRGLASLSASAQNKPADVKKPKLVQAKLQF